MLDGPFAPWPSFTPEEADAVSRVLLSNRVNAWTGEEVAGFEREFAAFAQTEHAMAVANGTLALDLALHGLGVGSRNGGRDDDEVIVTPRSFMASVSCVLNAGARPVFADVDVRSQNITPETAAPHVTPRTRAIICVHLAGWPCDMDGFRWLADEHGFALIEDCAQAHGALYKHRPVGGLGDVAAWSFCQDKIMTTGGEGGMVTCRDDTLWRRMWAFKDHGKSYAAVKERAHPPGFRWLHESVGTNWRMTEMQAAIGRIQLRRMPAWCDARAQNADALRRTLAPWAGPDGFLDLPDFTLESEAGHRHANYKFYAFVKPDHLPTGWTRDDVVAEIAAQGLPCMQGSCSEIYLERAFEGLGVRPSRRLPIARQLGETSLMFVVHPGVHEVTIDLSKGGSRAAA